MYTGCDGGKYDGWGYWVAGELYGDFDAGCDVFGTDCYTQGTDSFAGMVCCCALFEYQSGAGGCCFGGVEDSVDSACHLL